MKRRPVGRNRNSYTNSIKVTLKDLLEASIQFVDGDGSDTDLERFYAAFDDARSLLEQQGSNAL